MCRDASQVDLFVGSSYRKQKQLKFANGNLYKKFCLRSASVLCTVSTVFIGFVEPEINQLWGKVFDAFRQVNRSFDSKHLVFTTCAGFIDRESHYCSLLLFCVREINRFLEIPNRGSRKILRVSRNSSLETRASMLDSQKLRGSRIEFGVETVNLHLLGTVGPGGGGGGGGGGRSKFRRHASAVPNLIAIRFNCSTAEVRLWFRRCTRVVPNSGFSEHCWRHVTILPTGTQLHSWI